MAGSKPDIAFYLGIGSRYSYLASTQVERLSNKFSVTFQWRPILSSTLIAASGNSPFQWDTDADDWSGARTSGQYRESYRRADLVRWAVFYGVPYVEPKSPAMEPVRRTLYAVAATLLGNGPEFIAALFDVIYAKGVAINEEFCREAAASLDIDPDDLVKLIESGEASRAHDRWLEEAKQRELFGVPSFVYGDEIYWGNDRLVLLEAALTS